MTSGSSLTVDPPCLWKPSNPEETQMVKFRHYVNDKLNLKLRKVLFFFFLSSHVL